MAMLHWLAAIVVLFKVAFMISSALFAILHVILSLFIKLVPFVMGFLILRWRQHGRESGGQTEPRLGERRETFWDFLLAAGTSLLNRAVGVYQRLLYSVRDSHVPQLRLSRCSCQNSGHMQHEYNPDGFEQLQIREAIRRSLSDIQPHQAYSPTIPPGNFEDAETQPQSGDFLHPVAETRACPYPSEEYEFRSMPHPQRYGGNLYSHDFSSMASAPPLVYQRNNSCASDLYSVD